MAEGNADPQHQKRILGNIAAEEAALDVEIEEALRRYEALYHKVEMIDIEIAAKKEKTRLMNELIEAKKSELDGIMEQREEVRKRTESTQRNTENAKKLIEFYEKERIEKQKKRESIAARWQVLIDDEKEKYNSYPLVVERNKLRNELLAANVELGVWKFRNAAKERREKQMKEINQQLLNQSMIRMAQSFVDVRKLEEKKSKLQQERHEKAQSTSAALDEQNNEINLVERETTTVADWKNDKLPVLDSQGTDSSFIAESQPVQNVLNAKMNEIDDVLKNFREKFQARMLSSPVPRVASPSLLSIDGKRTNDSKSGEREKSEPSIPSSAKEKSNRVENTAINCEVEATKTADKTAECSNRNDPGEVLPRREESTTKDTNGSEKSDHHETNVRLRNALIATQSRNNQIASSITHDRKRALLQKTTAQQGLKYMRTDDVGVAPKRLPNNSQYRLSPSNPIDQGRGGKLHEPVAKRPGNYFNDGKQSTVRKVHSAARVQRDLERALPEDMDSRSRIREHNVVVPSTYFNKAAVERNEQVPPVPTHIQKYAAYDEYDENESNHEDDEPNPKERMHSMRGAIQKRYPNHEISAGERRNVRGGEYVAKEQECIANVECPGQVEYPPENGAGFDEDYPDPRDEIDPDDEYPGVIPSFDDGLRTRPNNNSSKDRSSSDGFLAGEGARLNLFDQDIFGTAEETTNHNPLDNLFGAPASKKTSSQNFSSLF